jgi:2-polyprenyl-3-methyl-5-hydroxy-6-metoxy-1,4-benzoquinol methylase
LPFGHKSLFAERIQRYDLYIYSEDDTLITERNIDAFVRVTPHLPDRYIAGFIRYEIAPDGRKYYSTIHSGYHWDPDSVLKNGDYIFAHYTNEHSACFIMTQLQLKKAIDSGGFLFPPRKGRYDMLVTAATDPYTQCGMKKLICISHLDDFSLHHLPNVYIGKIGLDAESARREIERLFAICGTDTDSGPLFDTSTRLEDASWDKRYYEPPRRDILSLVPSNVKRVLSVGCGCASTESELVKNGIDVVGIPLDCVVQVSAEASGVRVVSPSFEAAKESLRGEQFDCVLFSEVLQHISDPISLVRDFIALLGKDGWMIISVPNFNHPSVWRKRVMEGFPLPEIDDKRSFDKYKLWFTTRRMLYKWMKECGLQLVRTYLPSNPQGEQGYRFTMQRLKEKFRGILWSFRNRPADHNI